MIDLTDKIVALFAALSDKDIDALPPVQRRRLAEQCRRVADRADVGYSVKTLTRAEGDKNGKQPEAGVLADLRRGVRSE